MCALTLGSTVIISPHLIRELGVLWGTLSMAVITLIQYYAACVFAISTCKFLRENIITRTTRYAYQVIAEAAGGDKLRLLSVVTLYLGRICGAISNLLLAASTLMAILPTSTISTSNSIRVWATVLILLTTPLSFLGTFSDLKFPVILGLAASIVSSIGIIVNCGLVRYFYSGVNFAVFQTSEPQKSAFISLGSLFYLTASSANIPNICILCKEPEKILRPTTVNYLLNYIVFLVTGLIPYYTFNGNISASVITTFNDVIKRHADFTAFKIITYAVQGLMLFHFLIAVLLNLNPIFLHFEKTLGVAFEWSWKRVGCRTFIMFGILGVCLAIPHFGFAVSITGGVPLTIICAILPLYMYTRVFELSIHLRLAVYFIMLFVAVLILGNLVESIKDAVNNKY